MGNWHISIEGVGSHHNHVRDGEADANKMAAKFVQDLKLAGHVISKASFTHGGADNLEGSWYESYLKGETK
jgi:hypothetical protein